MNQEEKTSLIKKDSSFIQKVGNRVAITNKLIKSFSDITLSGSIVTDIDGNIYNTVKIGTQVWMKENLKVTRYRNGEIIPTTTPANLDIQNEETPKYQWVYDGNESTAAIYGRLYTWYAITDPRGICPRGWHIPTDEEWETLINYLGGKYIAGSKMREAGTVHWKIQHTGADNSSGFTALPGGYRGDYGTFGSLGGGGDWWSATENDVSDAWGRGLSYDDADADRDNYSKHNGFSVRCLRD